jgi:hypothetical protein
VPYKIEISPEAREQIRALPPALPKQLAEVMAMLELTPWHTKPINDDNPDGALRQLTFGDAGEVLLTFLILERQRRVDILEVMWLE